MEKNLFVPFSQTVLEHGFWHDRQQLNCTATIYAVWKQFKETGRFDAFLFDWKPEMPHKPHYFWDSDIAKWLEAAAYILEQKDDPQLEKILDETVDLIEQHQDENGYFNIYFTVVEPDRRFQDRTAHELYCAGHLMEAAVAYHHARGKDKFLRCMCRYADYIERIFVIEKSAAFETPGHEEIELALVRLYHCTGEKRYLALSQWFLDQRGNNDRDTFYSWAHASYAQSHLPVREQTTAEGHAVRATYLYSGMADVALEAGDESLFRACRALFENIAFRRMYITGGIGSSRNGEAFTVDYDLPNETAYTETCAAIALAMFARRMSLMDTDSLYADIAERAIYNGFLSGTSLDGKSFFYENPLEICRANHGRNTSLTHNPEQLPITKRVEVFSCSCCPPNITRFVASVADYLYTCNEDTLFVHQYMAGHTKLDIGSSPVSVRQKTDYPMDGTIKLTLEGMAGKTVALRIPGWCTSYTLTVDGKPYDGQIKKGYLYIPCDDDTMTLSLNLDMTVQLIEASSMVQENAGRFALQRGPIVYCLEEVDNGEQLRSLAVDRSLNARLVYDADIHNYAIELPGWRKTAFDGLYRPYSDNWQPQALRFIPYYAFANHGESDMLVWVQAR